MSSTPKNLFEKDIIGAIAREEQPVAIHWRNGTFLMDEPTAIGGTGLHPDPFTLLLGSLIGCSLSTMRMYIARKRWEITDIEVTANLTQDSEESLKTTITREIRFLSPATEQQRTRLLYIAERCPVAKLLEHTVEINTTIKE